MHETFYSLYSSYACRQLIEQFNGTLACIELLHTSIICQKSIVYSVVRAQIELPLSVTLLVILLRFFIPCKSVINITEVLQSNHITPSTRINLVLSEQGLDKIFYTKFTFVYK